MTKRSQKRSATGFVNAVLRKVTRVTVDFRNEANRLSMPGWLLERWQRKYGASTARTMAEAMLEAPQTYTRVTPAGTRIQDIGAQAVVPLLKLEAGQLFLDLCASPGNKTAQALESGVRAVACDRPLVPHGPAPQAALHGGAIGRNEAIALRPGV